MTACKDSLNGKKAVSATLAGVLAVGMVPAAAFAADQPADTASEEGIELQASPVADFNAGKAAAAENGLGQVISGDLTKVEFEAGSNKIGFKITEWQPEVGAAVTLKDTEWSETKYYEDADKDGVKGESESTEVSSFEAGKSYIAVRTGLDIVDGKIGPYKDCVATAFFKVVGQSLEGVTLYEHVASASKQDYTDSEFEWTGSAIDVKATKDGADFSADDIKYYKNGTEVLAANLKEPGDYVARVSKGGKTADVPFTINKLDLSKATVEMKDVPAVSAESPEDSTPQTFAIDKINGVSLATIDPKGDISATITSTAVYGENGTYTFKVAAKDSSTYAAGSKDVSWDKVAQQAAIKYNGNAITSNQTISFTTKGANIFNPALLTVTAGSEDITDDCTITVTDEDGNAVAEGLDALSKAGKYKVTVKVNAADLKPAYSYGGEVTFKANVTNATIDDADDVYFLYKGDVVDQSATKTLDYDGTDLAANVTTKVKNGKKELVEGTDYTVEIKKGSKVVDEAVLPGTYTITIKSDSYNITAGQTLTLEIGAIPVNATRAANLQNVGNGDFIAYTGQAIDLGVEYQTKVKDAKGELTWAELPASAYDVKSISFTAKGSTKAESVKEVKGEGRYVVTIVKADGDEADNYTIASGAQTITFDVSSQRVFKDVPSDAWYTKAVTDCALAGYMNGYAGTDLFGPNNDLTRAETATVLFNMAGGTNSGEDYTSEWGGYNTPFSDVAKGDWYAQAIGWASKTGIVKGYGDGTFGPNQNITREQFAQMLYNYAKATQVIEAFDVDATLAGVTDGASVSEWAREAVAWAVSNKIMGVNSPVNPSADITRAEAAAMLTRFAPYEAPAAADATVTFYGNGATLDAEDFAAVSTKEGASVALPTEEPTKAGKTFQGWSESATGQGRLYAAGETFVPKAGGNYLYAIWA